VQELLRSGFDRDEVFNMRNAHDTVAMRALSSADIPEQDARFYLEGVQSGDTLVIVRTSERKAQQAANILRTYNVVDIQARSAGYRQAGPQDMRARDLDAEGTVLPVVEERLDVGKREVQRGGVRVHTTIEEQPVEEQVTLREERVNVERRPVDRPVSDADASAFKEQSFEVVERAEEPVVRKQARVIEEVVVGKDVRERTETVRDTVRRQDVHVDERGAERAVGASDYDAYDAQFRSRFQTRYADGDYTYEQYTPVYRYGYSLASDPRYRDRDWSAIEADARRNWEERNPNTWDEFKDEIRYAWDRVRGRA
jgi:uncharacterized protein (TIGR02271 family)